MTFGARPCGRRARKDALAELGAVLLKEHEGRVRGGLV
jgi:hypothetical protein